jgi:hypothetical protein
LHQRRDGEPRHNSERARELGTILRVKTASYDAIETQDRRSESAAVDPLCADSHNSKHTRHALLAHLIQNKDAESVWALDHSAIEEAFAVALSLVRGGGRPWASRYPKGVRLRRAG